MSDLIYFDGMLMLPETALACMRQAGIAPVVQNIVVRWAEKYVAMAAGERYLKLGQKVPEGVEVMVGKRGGRRILTGSGKKARPSKEKEGTEAIHKAINKRIEAFHLDANGTDWADLYTLVKDVTRLKTKEIKAIGDRWHIRMPGNKTNMVARFEDWLFSFKRGADLGRRWPEFKPGIGWVPVSPMTIVGPTGREPRETSS